MKPLIKDIDKDEALIANTSHFRAEFKIPQYIMLVDRDNELLINLENLTSIRMFLDLVHKRESFSIKEFLFDDKGVVFNKTERFTNQIILSIYNKEKLQRNE